MSDETSQQIPELSVFDIETLEVESDQGDFELKLVSIAMASEIDNQTQYWVIDQDNDNERQKIGKLKFYFSLYFTL